MANNDYPGAYTDVTTNSTGVSVPGGDRTAVLLGEGSRVERLVAAAVGRGRDGLNSEYTSATNSDGRHFRLQLYPIISNRLTLFKNGIPLKGIETVIDDSSFSSRYDYRIEIESGKIELQGASLIDQGGTFYSANSSNVGNGVLAGLSLIDSGASTETWTVRCVSVRRDGYGEPIAQTARFIAQGSISGIPLDGYGNQIVWQSNGQSVDNSVLRFSITEGSTVFREGDRFTVKVKSGMLSRGDSLVAHYIAEIDINDIEFFDDLDQLKAKHGQVNLTNRLSLGAQIAFANSPPGIWTCQTAPSIPRRVSYVLDESASGNHALDDLSFRLPLGVIPDTDTNINFFVTDPVTRTEVQILPNKVTFYDSTYTTSPGGFTFGSDHEYSYTVILDPVYDLIHQQENGVLTPVDSTTATFSSETYLFTAADASVTRFVKISTPDINAGTYEIVSVSNGTATISRTSGTFTASDEIDFEVLDSASHGAVILFTEDLALTAGQQLRVTVVDVKDASFYDAGWQAAFEALERIDVDMVVPLPSQTTSAIFAAARVHCETMSQTENRKERILFCGAIRGLTPDNVLGNKPAAVEDLGILEGIQGDSITEILADDIEDLTDYGVKSIYGNTFRVVYCYPDEIVVQIGADQTKVDGFFMAAAAAGYLSGVSNIAVPLTRKNLAGFTILRDKLFKPSLIKNLNRAGMMVLQPIPGGGKVIWGRTTSASGSAEEEEISIIFIRDRIAKDLRNAFEPFVGNPESPDLQGSLQARANKYFVSIINKLITKFSGLRVMRDPADPRKWIVLAKAMPIYGVNEILLKLDVGEI